MNDSNTRVDGASLRAVLIARGAIIPHDATLTAHEIASDAAVLRLDAVGRVEAQRAIKRGPARYFLQSHDGWVR